VGERARQGSRTPLTLTTAAAPEEGLLVVVPPAVRCGEPIAPSVVLAGLPLVRRIALVAERAGLKPVVVGYPRSKVESSLAGSSAVLLAPGEPVPALSARRVVFLSLAVIPRPEWLREILGMPLEPEELHVDSGCVAVVEGTDTARVLAVASRSSSLEEVVAALGRVFKTMERSLGQSGRFVLATARDLPGAEAWLLRGLIKSNEGFMSRHFERRVSLALTRRLCTTGITPNAMTLVSIGVGLAGAPFFLASRPVTQLAGGLLFLAHSILDGCDGELARLKFLESRRGAVLDYCGDNLVHVAVFLGMAIGWSLDSGSRWPLYLGAIAIASTLSVATVVYRRGMRASTDGGPTSALSRVADLAVYRDFIYLIVLLAAVGKAQWFLALTAVGAPIFLGLLAWLGRRSSSGA
jgi:phosphatidylglycerophosphate synthase